MKRRSGSRRAIFILIFLLIVGVGGFFGYRYLTSSKEQETNYQKLTVSRGDLHVTILSTGTVAPENRLDIKPPIAGRVDEILVDEGDEVIKGQTLAWMSSTERAGLMDAASAKGPAVVKEWERLFKPTPILAPIAGRIIKRNVVSGQTFGTNDAVYTMSDRLIVNAQVDETDIGQIRIGQPVIITLDAYPNVNTDGEVNKIAFDATTVNNVTTYIVQVKPKDIPKVMRSGMTANVVFDVETRTNILLIPNGAIKVTNGTSSVLMPAKEEKKEPTERTVVTGITDGKSIEIKSGLSENEVILVPEFKLKDSTLGVNPFSPMRNRRAEPKKPPS